MNRRETAQEPSMEDILASIRKIIADDPPAATPVPPVPKSTATGVFAAVPSQRIDFESASRTVSAPLPGHQGSLSARLNDVFGPGVVAEPAAASTQRPLPRRTAIDDDLGDLLAVGPAAKPQATTEPTPQSRPAPVVIAQAPARVPPGVVMPAPVPAEPAVAAVAAQPQPAAAPANIENRPPIRATPARIEPSLMLPSFAHAPVPALKSAPVVIAAMPQRPVHVGPPVAPEPGPAFVPPMPDLVTPVAAELPQPAPVAVETPAASAPLLEPTRAAADMVAPRPSAVNAAAGVPQAPRVEPIASTLADVDFTLPQAAQPDITTTPLPPITPVGIAAAIVTRAQPMPVTAEPANALDPSADAVASALGALAAGLAASARPATPEIIVSAIEVTTPSAVQPSDRPGAPSTALLRSNAASVFTSPDTFVGGVALQPIETRTLDDTAAELLRPMLRQWLDANMPRIVEKALRIELANPTVAPPPQPPET